VAQLTGAITMSEAEDTTSQTIQHRGAEPLTKREQMARTHERPEPPVVPVEIRVHGVSGTPPEQMLVAPGIDHPAVRQVAGDAAAGFYVQDGAHPSPIEAYSWGGLTSGGKLRALWLLLVPFMLVNLAFWTASSPLGDPGGRAQTARARRTLEAALRLFALSLTAAFVLAFVVASMDIVGWQYIRQADQLNIGWLSFLSWGPLDSPNVQLMLTALVPLALILLLWHLGRSTWQRLESTAPPSVDPVEELRNPLEDRAMWNGERPVRRLRALHISFAMSMLGLFLVMPLLMDPGSKGFAALSTTWQRASGRAALVIAAALAACVVIAVVMACLPSLSDRNHRKAPEQRDRRVWVALEIVAVALLAAAAALLLLPGPWQAVWPGATSGSLPGSVASVQILFVAQGLLALVVFLGAWRLRVLSGKEQSPETPAMGEGPGVKADPAWHGLAPGFLTVIAWLLGGGLAAGLALVVARLIGTPLSSAATPASLSSGSNPVVVPAPFIWAAVAILPVVVCALVIAVVTYSVIRRGSGKEVDAVREVYPQTPVRPQAYEKRVRWIAQGWARGRLIDKSVTPVGVLVVATGLIVLTGSVLYVRDPTWVTSQAGWLVTVAVLAMATVMLWLLQLVRRVYQDPGTRRQVGMIWDLGTFWPRAVHPLAPPCYAERAIPDLITRIEFHTGVVNQQSGEVSGNRPVVLSCHSQGSVIGLATILQLTYEGSQRVALLTYGNPVRRLYSRFFPAYFGLGTVTRVGSLLGETPRHHAEDWQNEASAGTGARAIWRWRNLYRPTDPIGGPVFLDPDAGTCAEDQVDWNLKDPVAAEPLPGDTCCPPALGHSDYFVDPEFTHAEGQLNHELVLRWEPVAQDRQRRA
jgi:hypothetical protein